MLASPDEIYVVRQQNEMTLDKIYVVRVEPTMAIDTVVIVREPNG